MRAFSKRQQIDFQEPCASCLSRADCSGCDWEEPANGGIRSEGIVTGFNLSETSEDCCFFRRICRETGQIGQSAFQTAGKIPSHCIAVRTAFAGHALPNIVLMQCVTVSLCSQGTRRSLWKNQVRRRFPATHSHLQRRKGQCRVDAVRKSTAGNGRRPPGCMAPLLAGRAPPRFLLPRAFCAALQS